MSRPEITIVVPVHDRTELLRRTILSLFAQETDHSFEIVVVQDGSPDATRNVVRSLEYDSPVPFRSFSFGEASGTASRGRNLGIAEAKGAYIAFSDSDDISRPYRLQASMDELSRAKVSFVAGRVQYVVDKSRPLDIAVGQTSEWVPLTLGLLRTMNPVVPSTVLLERDVLLSNGGFRPGMRYREDHELWLRLAYRGVRMSMSDKVLADYFIHAGNNELAFLEEDDHWRQVMLGRFTEPFATAEWGH